MKSGFVNIVGNPNVGKSTLANQLVGERLSIITQKAQTTRHRIMGILNGEKDGEKYQIVFSDTPGVLRPSYKLQEQMLEFSRSALVDADILLYVTEANDTIEQDNQERQDFLLKVRTSRAKVILVINKIDLLTEQSLQQLVEYWHKQLPDAEIVAISAKEKFGTQELLNHIIDILPEGHAYFGEDQLTDRPERFFVNEIIREKILLNYDKEIPYSVEVEVEKFTEEENLIRINAVIYVERDSQKGIIIGKQGTAIKKVGASARKDIEQFLGKKVFLELFVKVDKDWRQNQYRLKHYGYKLD